MRLALCSQQGANARKRTPPAALRFARSATVADRGPFRACIGNRCSRPSPSFGRARLVLPQERAPAPAAASTNHQARGGPARAVIWLLLLAGERPKQKPLGRGRTGDNAERPPSWRWLRRVDQTGPGRTPIGVWGAAAPQLSAGIVVCARGSVSQPTGSWAMGRAGALRGVHGLAELLRGEGVPLCREIIERSPL